MMGDCRAGHIQQGGDVQHTFLAVAEYPEDAQPGAVTQLLEYIGHSLEIFCIAYLFLQKLAGSGIFVVIVRQVHAGLFLCMKCMW